MTRDQIIETMARAKCQREGYKPDMEYLGTGTPLWRRFEPEATADLAALESAGLAVMPVEPTDAMILGAEQIIADERRMERNACVTEIYAAMIAAAQGAHKP